MKSQHHTTAAWMAGRTPGITIHPNELSHLGTAERYGHQMMPKATGILERFFCPKRGNPERRSRGLCRPRLRRHVCKTVKASPARDVLLSKKQFDLFESLIEAGAGLIHRHGKQTELV